MQMHRETLEALLPNSAGGERSHLSSVTLQDMPDPKPIPKYTVQKILYLKEFRTKLKTFMDKAHQHGGTLYQRIQHSVDLAFDLSIKTATHSVEQAAEILALSDTSAWNLPASDLAFLRRIAEELYEKIHAVAPIHRIRLQVAPEPHLICHVHA
jgi:hypothetical protein